MKQTKGKRNKMIQILLIGIGTTLLMAVAGNFFDDGNYTNAFTAIGVAIVGFIFIHTIANDILKENKKEQ